VTGRIVKDFCLAYPRAAPMSLWYARLPLVCLGKTCFDSLWVSAACAGPAMCWARKVGKVFRNVIFCGALRG
jgi:hypothetical protein